jgi:putative aminopeptidase FrvX
LTAALTSVSKKNMQRWINGLSSFYTRHTKSKFIDRVAEWLKAELQKFGYTDVHFHGYTESGYQLKNVICHKQGKSNNKLILICAHYDSIMEDTNNTKERAPGADDNASGVSASLEIARILSQVDLKNTIQFAFFSGEEQGQWGSKKYSQYLKENNVNIHVVINLDMVGRPPLNPKKVIIERDTGNEVLTNDQGSQTLSQIMEQMATHYTDLEVVYGPIYDSDYMPFEALGHVVLGVYDDGQNDPTYHSKLDVPSTLNMDYITSVTKMMLATILNESTSYK